MRLPNLVTLRTSYLKTCVRRESMEHVRRASSNEKMKRTTVNSKEIEHFSKFDWWGVNKIVALHKMNPLRVEFVRNGLANAGFNEINPGYPLEGVKILDVGCGGGILSEVLARAGADTTGLDASAVALSVAKEHAALDPALSGRINYVQGAIEEFSIENEETFDAVVASEVIEHVDEQQLFLKHCVKTLKPGGSIFITTFNKTLLSYIGGIIMAEYVFRIVTRGTHEWNKFVPPQDTQRMLENYGCKTRLIHGMIYNPLTTEWSWVSFTAMCYALHAVKEKSRE